jgi:hypothetical protein
VVEIPTMTDIPLVHCPFCYPHPACDEYPPFVTQEIAGSNSYCVWARCCDFYGPLFATPELAAEAWNRRALVTKLEDKETIDLFEGILGADPQAFLTESVVYSVTQNELLKFASVLAPRHASEAVARLQRRLTAEREGMEEYKAQQCKAVTALEEELETFRKAADRWEKHYEQQKGCARNFKDQRDQLKADSELALNFANVLLENLGSLDEHSMSGLDCEIVALMQSEVSEFISTMQAHEKHYTSPNEVITAPAQDIEDAKRLCILLSSDRKDMLGLLREFSEDIDITDVQLVAETIQSLLEKMNLRRDEIFQISNRVFKDLPPST